MTTTRVWMVALTALGCSMVPSNVQAQDPPPAAQVEPELVFEREVFEYPSFPRANPFLALSASNQGGPRYEQLALTGIIWDSDPTRSVAVVTAGAAAYNAKVGQRIGNTTLREIQRDRVLVDVEEFGLTDRRTLFIASRRPGGTQ